MNNKRATNSPKGNLDRFELGDDLGAIENKNEYERRVNSLPAEERELAQESARFADLCQYCERVRADIPPEILDQLGAAGRLSTEQLVDGGNAIVQVATDNLHTLQAAQTAVVNAYTALDKSYQGFLNRKDRLHIVRLDPGQNVLIQDIVLGPDYAATDTGVLSCTSDAAAGQLTTDAINYSILYQNIPLLTVSAGLLTTFQDKTVIGTAPRLNPDGTASTFFTVTDSAEAQVFPMAFVNYRFWSPVLKTWWEQRENELVITNNISAGIGINPNTGTNQPEFFIGDAVAFSRVYFHIGAHFGRTETLGGGFSLNTQIPSGFSGSAPISWNYHPAFAIGFSVRLAPF